MKKKYETLHAHSTDSDGELTHEEILEECAKNNIGIVAITDHDSLPNEHVLSTVLEIPHETKWISGIEISSSLPRELGGRVHGGLHILGLFVDPRNTKLGEHCAKAKEARISRMQKIVHNLESIGIHITEEECLSYSNGEAVTRPHIVKAILAKEGNVAAMMAVAEKMRTAGEDNPAVKRKYAVMLEAEVEQYPFTLFLSSDAYIPGIYVEYEYTLDLDQSVSIIRDAGGLAFIAHYFTVKQKIDLDLLAKLIQEKRLDGAEAVFGFREKNTSLKDEVQKDQEDVQKVLEIHKGLWSGSVDAHYRSEYGSFAKDSDYASQTIGLTKKIVEESGISLEHSTLTKEDLQ